LCGHAAAATATANKRGAGTAAKTPTDSIEEFTQTQFPDNLFGAWEKENGLTGYIPLRLTKVVPVCEPLHPFV
jgi:hypothetical protein